jgi:methyl-accepting chemotaxis protein
MLNIQNLKLENLKLKNRILLGYSIPIAILVGLNGLVFFDNQRVSNTLKSAESTEEGVAVIQEMRHNLNRASRTFRGYLLDKPDKMADTYKIYQENLKNYREAVATAEKLQLTSEQEKELKEIISMGDQFIAYVDPLMNATRQGNRQMGLDAYNSRQEIQMIRNLDTKIEEFTTQKREALDTLKKRTQEELAFSSLIYSLSTLISIAISFFGGLVIAGGIAKTLKEAASQVTDSSSLISNTVTQQERIVVEQAESVNQTSSTMDQLGLVSLQSAIQAEASAEGAQKALNIAEDGAKAIEQTMTTMANLKERVQAIAQQIITLSEQTSQINRVSNLVGDLANQTNMLALNAAVEAARAGEQGKGFGVVASEIRKLADESKKSAEKINTLVNDIQSSMNSTVMVTDEGTKTAEESIKLAQESVQAFLGVAEAINLVFDNSREIEQSAKQQAIAVQEVVAAINALNLGAQETTEGIASVKTSTDKLNSAARQLEAVV